MCEIESERDSVCEKQCKREREKECRESVCERERVYERESVQEGESVQRRKSERGGG